MNPWISGRSCESTGTVRNDDRAKETEKAEVEDDSVVLSVSVEDIKWPEKLQAYLPSSMTLDVEVGEEDSLGDAICDKIKELLDVYPQGFYYFVIDDDEDDEDENESEDEGTDGSMLDDLIDAVSKPTITGRVFAVLGVIADHGLLPSEEDDTDSEDEDCNCECDDDCECDCDECPCEDEDSEEDEEVSEDEYIKMCADFLNGLVNLVIEARKEDSKDTDK